MTTPEIRPASDEEIEAIRKVRQVNILERLSLIARIEADRARIAELEAKIDILMDPCPDCGHAMTLDDEGAPLCEMCILHATIAKQAEEQEAKRAKVEADLRAQLAEKEREIAEAMRQLAPNCAEETLLGAIRNVQQAALTNAGNVETLESLLATERAAREKAEEMLRSMKVSVVATIGGKVEGAPTHEGNYLQRLRQLLKAEARLVETEEAIEAGWKRGNYKGIEAAYRAILAKRKKEESNG